MTSPMCDLQWTVPSQPASIGKVGQSADNDATKEYHPHLSYPRKANQECPRISQRDTPSQGCKRPNDSGGDI